MKTIILGIQPNLTERQANILREQLEPYTKGYNLVLSKGVVGGVVLDDKTSDIEFKVDGKDLKAVVSKSKR